VGAVRAGGEGEGAGGRKKRGRERVEKLRD